MKLIILLLSCMLGPLHGIPYGLKDIIAVPHYRTTWGSETFKDQVLDIEAWVYKRYSEVFHAEVCEIENDLIPKVMLV